jgi:hypothetical protein
MDIIYLLLNNNYDNNIYEDIITICYNKINSKYYQNHFYSNISLIVNDSNLLEFINIIKDTLEFNNDNESISITFKYNNYIIDLDIIIEEEAKYKIGFTSNNFHTYECYYENHEKEFCKKFDVIDELNVLFLFEKLFEYCPFTSHTWK